MTKLEKLALERDKITKEINEICKEENQSKLETAKQYIGQCFSYKDKESIKIIGCQIYGSVTFKVLSLSKSRADRYILWYDDYEFSSVIGNKNWEEISAFEFSKTVNAEVQKLLGE